MIVNTWQQMVAAGGGYFIGYTSDVGRGGHGQFWQVIHVAPDGKEIPTNPQAPWYYHRRAAFALFSRGVTHGERKKAALGEAVAWVANKTGRAFQWERNRTGDYVPADVNARFPIPKRTAPKAPPATPSP